MNRAIVIGGGFFGACIAEHLVRKGAEVHLFEKEDALMTRASFNNQARVHNGYHYPRSVLTALRSRLSFPRFVSEFRDCVDASFEMQYLIGKPLGKVTGRQFQKFCDRVGARCVPASHAMQKLVNPGLIEACFSVTEYAFDAVALREKMMGRLADAGVQLHFGTSARRIRREGPGLVVEVGREGGDDWIEVPASVVFNCAYSRINYLNANSGLELIPLKHEVTEMCLVEVPHELRDVGITVMCGPFFSVMPFPSAGLHSFSHVRYTPRLEWSDEQGGQYADSQRVLDEHGRASAWRHMRKDAARYIPLLDGCVYRRSLWETKTVLPRSESDDSRPILLKANHSLEGFHCVMGGKIDNVYDAIDAIETKGLAELGGGAE